MNRIDEKYYLIVVSDHGNVPNREVYSFVKALADKGFIKKKSIDGKLVIDGRIVRSLLI